MFERIFVKKPTSERQGGQANNENIPNLQLY